MTSKEALERLGAEKLARGQLIRNDDKVEPYINCIKQDLERYEYICNLLKRCIEKIELSSNIFPSNLYRLIIDLTEQELELLKEVIQ